MAPRRKIFSMLVSILLVQPLLYAPTASCDPKSHCTILIDLDDIVIYQDSTKRFWEVGPSHFIGWYNPITVKEDYFKSLDLVLPHKPGSPLIVRNGDVLPQIINDWLANNQSAHEIRTFVLNGLKNLTKHQGRNTKVQQAIADFVFTPERYARTMVVQNKGKELLKKCYARRDSSGRRANRIYLVSNWNAESFACLRKNKKMKKILSYFDGIFISGELHVVMPDPEFIYQVLKKVVPSPQEKIIFINAEITMIKMAQSLHIPNLHTVHCKDFDYKYVDKELKRLGVYA